MKIPITKSLSVQPDDVIGSLEIDEMTADEIAALSAEKMEIHLETSIQRKGKKWVLHLVFGCETPGFNGAAVRLPRITPHNRPSPVPKPVFPATSEAPV